jgi:hypothetical protein
MPEMIELHRMDRDEHEDAVEIERKPGKEACCPESVVEAVVNLSEAGEEVEGREREREEVVAVVGEDNGSREPGDGEIILDHHLSERELPQVLPLNPLEYFLMCHEELQFHVARVRESEKIDSVL